MLQRSNTVQEKYVNSHTKLAKIFGTQTHQLEVKSTYQSISPSYIVLYVFQGTYKRGGIGHIALWDGASYYSYGAGDGEFWIEDDTFSLARSNKHACLDNKIWNYGPFKKIILPCNQYLTEHYSTIRSNIQLNWKNNDYSMLNKNCAHMVQEYLVQSRYTIPISDSFLFPLYPSEVADNAKNIGKAIVKKIVDEVRTKIATPHEMQLYKDFLVLLNDMIAVRPVISQLQIKEFHDAMQGGISDQEKFCKIFTIIARYHYDSTSFAYETNESDRFYEKMFMGALQVSALSPKFENESQVNKTGRLRNSIAIARAAVGAVLAVILFVPTCVIFPFYKLYNWVKKRPPPAMLASPVVDLDAPHQKHNRSHVTSIHSSIDERTPLMTSVVKEETEIQENKDLSIKSPGRR